MKISVHLIDLLISEVAKREVKYKIGISVQRIHQSSCRGIMPSLTKGSYFLFPVFKNYEPALTQYACRTSTRNENIE